MQPERRIESNQKIFTYMGIKSEPFKTDISEGFTCSSIQFPTISTSEYGPEERAKEVLLRYKLFYHEKWQWLMPVVEKICRTRIGGGGTEFYPYLRPFGMINEDTGGIMVRFTGFTVHEATTLIEATWFAVLEVIEWLEQNKIQ